MKNTMGKLIGIIAIAVGIGFGLAGCGGKSVVVNVTNIATKLAALPETAPDAPAVIKLTPINIRTTAWKQVTDAVANAGRFVILDLSACSATDNTITGAQGEPSDTDMNIIQDNEYIKGIILPRSLTDIGELAFGRCDSLTSVTLPGSVTSIGRGAFGLCESLTSVTIPGSVTSIGEYAFYECSSLTSVTIPSSVTSIGEYAFYECSSLTSVTIPGSVISIGEYAFYECSSLTSVIFGRGSNIDESAFPGSAFEQNLRAVYLAANPREGTYRRNGDRWAKQ
jgi:hypothetical protein